MIITNLCNLLRLNCIQDQSKPTMAKMNDGGSFAFI